MADGLHVPGREQIGNPLTVLTAALEQQSSILTQGFNSLIKIGMASQRHVYALQYVEDVHGAGFITYCHACSEAAERQVFPCIVNSEEDMPRPPAAFSVEAPRIPRGNPGDLPTG